MNNKTTTTKTEYLSAFLDDEAGVFEQRRMLDEAQKDNELKQKIASYSLIGEAMRNESSQVTVQANFLAGIHDKLADQPVYHDVQIDREAANSPTGIRSWMRPVTGMAIAASLAAVTVVALNMNNGSDEAMTAGSTVVAQQETTTKPTKPTEVLLAKASTDSSAIMSAPDMAWRKRLRRYVNSHAKYASTSAIMPSIRAASYASSY